MKIVVIGGTGLIGSNLVNRLSRPDYTVIPASPQTGVNSITGEGLSEALKTADVLVDVSNSPSFEDQAVMDFFQRSTMNLLSAAAYAGIKHYVALSIVGADRLPGSGYLRAKTAQEELIRVSGIPYTILRSTQFFEFAGRIAQDATNGNVVHVSNGGVQPIASGETVAALADIVLNPPLNAIVEVGGPERMSMAEFISLFLESTNDPRRVVVDDNAQYFGVKLGDNSLVAGKNARLGKTRYQDWFKSQLATA